MARQWWYPADSKYVAIGVDWQAVEYPDRVTILPIVYRWDSLNTVDSAELTENLYGCDGDENGPWGGIEMPGGSGTRTIPGACFNARRTITKSSSAKTVRLSFSTSSNFGTYYSGAFHTLGACSGSITLTVDALESYTVSFDANGGSGAPASQDKDYGKPLTLSKTKPTMDGFIFTGWNTSKDGSGASYQPGATYSSNESVTLYAQWTSSGPRVTSFSAYRSDSEQNPSGDGTFITVLAVADGDITSADVSATQDGGSDSIAAMTVISGSTVTSVMEGADTEHSWTVRADLSNGSGTTTVYAGVSGAYFVMDFSPSGGVAIGTQAADSKRLDVGISSFFTGDAAFSGDVSFGGSVSNASDGTAAATVASGWKLSTNNLIRKGDIVHAQIYASPTASKTLNTTESTICTLPAGFRPKTQMWIPVLGTNGVYALLGIGSGGAVTISRGIYPGSSAWTTVTTSYTFWITVSFMAG